MTRQRSFYNADGPGLDPSRYATTSGEVAEKQFFTFESQISDKERFKDADQLSIRCPSCASSFVFDGLSDDSVSPICQCFRGEAELSSPMSSNRRAWYARLVPSRYPRRRLPSS